MPARLYLPVAGVPVSAVTRPPRSTRLDPQHTRSYNMGIDLQLLQNDKGGDFEGVCASQKKRFAPEELAHEVLALYKEWTKSE